MTALKGKNGQTDRSQMEFEQIFLSDNESSPMDAYDQNLSDLGIEEWDKQKSYQEKYKAQYMELKYHAFLSDIGMMRKNKQVNALEDLIEVINTVYRESYSDLQMILLLAVHPEDYLNLFIMKYDVGAGYLFDNSMQNPEDAIRISIIFRIMTDTGIWEKTMFREGAQKELEDWIMAENDKAYEEIGRQHADALQQGAEVIAAYKKTTNASEGFIPRIHSDGDQSELYRANTVIDIKSYSFLLDGLYDYLLCVMLRSLAEYEKAGKKDKILELRRIVKRVLDFENTTDVFNCIEEEIEQYKRNLLKL